MKRLLILAAMVPLLGASGSVPDGALELPAQQRAWYRNPDGSCVQCSIGMCGQDQNVATAATLLWDSRHGSAVRGGSNPSRVAEYCREREIKAYNVTGRNTWDWMRWAVYSGRPASIGAGVAHFQTLACYDPQTKTWLVCDNNSPTKIDQYSESAFRRLHLSSGQWVVILDYPPHPASPRYFRWW